MFRDLLDATRKLQRQFETRGIDLFSVVFIRNDIDQHLIVEPAERGKETAAMLDWNDIELFNDLLGGRIAQTTHSELSFDEVWSTFFTPHVPRRGFISVHRQPDANEAREVLRFVRDCGAVCEQVFA